MEFKTEIKYRNLPVVVLAGRPNVGKSTLFNRLLHKRRAITDPTPGVTRDPVSVDCFIGGRPLRLVDTGGFKLTVLLSAVISVLCFTAGLLITFFFSLPPGACIIMVNLFVLILFSVAGRFKKI